MKLLLFEGLVHAYWKDIFKHALWTNIQIDMDGQLNSALVLLRLIVSNYLIVMLICLSFKCSQTAKN